MKPERRPKRSPVRFRTDQSTAPPRHGEIGAGQAQGDGRQLGPCEELPVDQACGQGGEDGSRVHEDHRRAQGVEFDGLEIGVIEKGLADESHEGGHGQGLPIQPEQGGAFDHHEKGQQKGAQKHAVEDRLVRGEAQGVDVLDKKADEAPADA